MRRKTWFLSALVVMIAAGAIGLFLFQQILVLELGNTDRPRTLQVRISPSDRFTLSYMHSMYHERVTEEFAADREGIVLKGVRTKSSAVREYYRFEESKDFHPLSVKLGTLFLRVGEGDGQELAVKDRTIHFRELGQRGDRIRLGARTLSMGRYLYAKAIKK